MKEKTAWEEKAWRKKSHEGYADVAYEDVWALDMRLARIIANHLRAFLKAEKGPYGGTPGHLVEKFGEDEAYNNWLNIIRKMIYAFEEYQREDKFDVDPEKKARIKEGMQLFIDYYRDLWM